MNGTAAVGFFFTLSGFVLSWSYFQRRDTESLRRAFLRRWPRLAGIVVLSTVLSAALYQAGLYYFSEAAQVSGSPSFCYLYLRQRQAPQATVLALTFLCTLLGTLALSWPLEKFDAWWVALVGRHIASAGTGAGPAQVQLQAREPT